MPNKEMMCPNCKCELTTSLQGQHNKTKKHLKNIENIEESQIIITADTIF